MGRSRPNFSPKLEPIHRTMSPADFVIIYVVLYRCYITLSLPCWNLDSTFCLDCTFYRISSDMKTQTDVFYDTIVLYIRVVGLVLTVSYLRNCGAWEKGPLT